MASGLPDGPASSHLGPASTPAHLPRQVSRLHAGLAGMAAPQAASAGAAPVAVVVPLRFGSFTSSADAPFVQLPLPAAESEKQAGIAAPVVPQLQQMGTAPAGLPVFAQGQGPAASVQYTVPATASSNLGIMLEPPAPHLGPARAESEGEVRQRQDAAYPPVSCGGQEMGPALAEHAPAPAEQPHPVVDATQGRAQGQSLHGDGSVHPGSYMAPYLPRPQGPDESGFCQDPDWSQAMYMQVSPRCYLCIYVGCFGCIYKTCKLISDETCSRRLQQVALKQELSWFSSAA